MSSVYSNLIRGILALLSGKFARILLSIATLPLLTRILSSEGYGDYGSIMSLVAIGMIFANSGIQTAVRKYISENRNVDDWKTYVFMFYMRLSILIVAIVVIVIISIYTAGLVKGSVFHSYILFVALIIITKQFFALSTATLMGLNLEPYSESITVLNKILFAAIGISLAYVGFSVSGVLIGHVLGLIISAFVALYLLKSEISYNKLLSPIPSKIPKKELLMFNFKNVFLLLFMYSLYHTDVLLLRTLVGAEQTGYYKAALSLAEMIWIIPSAFSMVFVHNTSRLWYENDLTRINTIASKATQYTALFTSLLAIGLFVLADSFIPIYLGNEFSASTSPIRILLPGVVFFAIAKPIYAIGQGKGQLTTLLTFTFLSAFLNLILNIILIPAYGMQGAAVATSISYGSMLVFHTYAAYRIGFNPLMDFTPFRFIFVVIVSFALIYSIDLMIDSDWLSLIMIPGIGLVIFLILGHFVRIHDYRDIKRIRDEFDV